ncbi:hypothetical protein AVEN_101912-1 [Araneus ventricosus]|uniref:Endonuclease/exonuclease/phosphatase domain-containing protein n=1 Tax=Araneus ventricosus TaxID=182803 RepID=A0A4Y2D687_ARAVE|nr:hypothetical protein AVEN_240629-1 [Araneus ventricosus]GBM13063.1 hypothetical protein AVEN_101912-1 [Araneus ventricosus]
MDVNATSSGGVCILISNLHPSGVLSLHTSLQAVAVQIHFRTLITICSVYLPPHETIRQEDLNILIDQLSTPFILVGHSMLWDSADTNSRGRQMEKLISGHCLLNNDEKTHFHEPSRTFHSIDLAICSPSILPVLNFAVGSDLHNSDHFPLLFSHADSVTAATRPSKYLFQRADWKKFTLLAISEDMVRAADINDAVRYITETIIWAADAAIPKNSPNPHKLRKPWWNDACHDAARRQKRLWGIFRRYPTTENLISFKAAKAYACRVRRQSRRESFIRFVSFITSTPSSQIWRSQSSKRSSQRLHHPYFEVWFCYILISGRYCQYHRPNICLYL